MFPHAIYIHRPGHICSLDFGYLKKNICFSLSHTIMVTIAFRLERINVPTCAHISNLYPNSGQVGGNFSLTRPFTFQERGMPRDRKPVKPVC